MWRHPVITIEQVEAALSPDDVRMAILAPIAAAELGISLEDAERLVREICAEEGWPVQDVGHA